MAEITVNRSVLASFSKDQLAKAAAICPFDAIELREGTLYINSGCRMCKICVKNDSHGIFELTEADAKKQANKELKTDKAEWKGIAVYIEIAEKRIHPVSLELIGKARELARKVDFPVYALLMGHNIKDAAAELPFYGVDEVFVYDYAALENFNIEPYTNVFEDFIKVAKPSSILVGATPAGRSLAPRVAARMRTGLTADCTKLDIKQNTDLVQIRPAFGGNIMAQICTPNHRPQLATVRYKIFDMPERREDLRGKLTYREISNDKLESRVKIVGIQKKESKRSISEADVIVAVGRGLKAEKDMAMVYELAELLRAELATTRPLIEAGWISPNRQIGLSGRTVKPKLIFTLGVSGSVQFKAGMENSDLIISVNTDENANIFDVCHYAVKADIYDIIPKLAAKIKEESCIKK